MSDQTCKAEQFRALHMPGKPLVLFNIWDAGGAKAVTVGGAKAIATGSWTGGPLKPCFGLEWAVP